jgi:hypothetical protein
MTLVSYCCRSLAIEEEEEERMMIEAARRSVLLYSTL